MNAESLFLQNKTFVQYNNIAFIYNLIWWFDELHNLNTIIDQIELKFARWIKM